MKQIFRDRKKAVPFILCAAVILLNIAAEVFGLADSGDLYYYGGNLDNTAFLLGFILPLTVAAALMMVQIASKQDDLKGRIRLAAFYLFMAAGQALTEVYTAPRTFGGTAVNTLMCVLIAALLAMIVLILTGKAKRWMYAAVSVAGMVTIVLSLWMHCVSMGRLGMSFEAYVYMCFNGNSPCVFILKHISMFLLYVVILVCEDGKITGKLNRGHDGM